MNQNRIQIKIQIDSPKGSMHFSWTIPLLRWHHKPSNWQEGPSLEEWERASEHLAYFLGLGFVAGHVTMFPHFLYFLPKVKI